MNDVGHHYEYETFAILVGSRVKRGYPITVTQSPAGDAHTFCRIDPKASPLQKILGTLESGQADEATLLRLGDLLFHALFTDIIVSNYRFSLSLVRGQGKQLRVRITIEPPELAVLPWEFLHDAQEDTFLAISPETALIRYIPIQLPVHPTATSLPLRILVVIANPKDIPALDVEREQSIIQEALAEWTTQGSVQLQFLKRATVAEIGQAMRSFHPHIFHFVGHSSFAQEQACIFLENDDRSARPITERIFREFFTGYPDTRLAVLNACQTATTSVRQPLVGMAPRLLQRQLSAVVAMQYPILDTTSLIFTREFYRSLALGYPLEVAISEARRGIYLEVDGQASDWGIPVLFLRAQDGQLFQVEIHETQRQTRVDSAITLATGENATKVSTGSGTYVAGDVQAGNDFVGRDKNVQGDEVHGDKVVGNKTEVHIGRVEPGAQVIIGETHITQAAPLVIPPPPEPVRPPEPAGFVGREAELAYYTERLQTTHFAAICGLAGVGKSALAAVLAQRMAAPDKVFWHSFHAEEGMEPLLWQLAGFLARQGQNELWQMLHTARQSPKELPPATLSNYLLQLLRGRGYLLCLDDFQFVDQDPLVIQLVERLRTLLAEGELSLIITARHLPDFIETTEFIELRGLSPTDTSELLAARHLSLPDPLFADLQSKTEGNAQLLTLAIEALRRTTNPAGLVERLVETRDIERYLMNEVNKGLSSGERAVMQAVAVLLGYVGTREAIEAIAGGDSIRRTLHDLTSRYLLVVQETELGREYGQHATLQAFYYDLLGQREQKIMHRRAGDHYVHAEPDALKAVRHYQAAEEFAQASELAVQHLWAIINQGQGRALRQLLDHFTAKQLDSIQWAQMNLARGDLYTLLGESELARESFERVLTSVTAATSPETHKLRMHVYEGMGWLLEQESPQEALEWLQRGLQELIGTDKLEEATLQIRMGSAQSAIGEFEVALESLQRGLALLPEEPSQLRASALMNIGNIYSSQGDLQQGSDYYRQALAISEQLHDEFRILAIRSNLAIDKEIAGDWIGAIADYQQALGLAERLGSVVDQVRLANSLGTIYIKQGDDRAAAHHLEQAIGAARTHENREDLAYSLTSLAELKTRMGEMQAVAESLTEAEQLAQELDLESLLTEIHCLWAQLYLRRGELAQAVAYAERAVQSAQDLDLKVEAGRFLRTLARTQAATEQTEQALATMARSLALLADRDPYEAACTQLAWGQLLTMNGEVARGQALLQEAQSTFSELDARRDLLATDQLLHQSR